MGNRRVRVALVGAGARGQLFADAIRGMPEVEIVGFADPAAPGEVLGYRCFHDHKALFGSTEPDAVILATPDHQHAETVIDAAQMGLHLLIEKPLATTADDTDSMVSVVQQAGITCMTAFENRWNPLFLELKRLVEADPQSSIRYQRYNLSNALSVPTEVLSWAGHSSPLWFLMPHIVDLSQWISGKKVVSVSANGSRKVLSSHGIDTWDFVQVLARYDDGSSAALASSWILPNASPSVVEFDYDIVLDNSRMRGQVLPNGIEYFDRGTPATLEVPGATVGTLKITPPAMMARNFIDVITGNAENGSTFEEGVYVNAVLLAIERSLMSGQVEEVVGHTETKGQK